MYFNELKELLDERKDVASYVDHRQFGKAFKALTPNKAVLLAMGLAKLEDVNPFYEFTYFKFVDHTGNSLYKNLDHLSDIYNNQSYGEWLSNVDGSQADEETLNSRIAIAKILGFVVYRVDDGSGYWGDGPDALALHPLVSLKKWFDSFGAEDMGMTYEEFLKYTNPVKV